MPDSPIADTPTPSRPRLLLRQAGPWLIVPGAVVLGLLLFLAIWLAQREAPEAGDEAPLLPPPAQEASPAAALPAPQVPDAGELMPAEGGGPDSGSLVDEQPVVRPPPAPPAPDETVSPAPPPPAQAPESTAAADSAPVPVRTPSPRYPRASLRRGEAGEVLVQVTVDADGRPRQVEIARSSSHPALDQAALNAVRRWRFRPALQGGQPVAQAIHVPVMFSPQD